MCFRKLFKKQCNQNVSVQTKQDEKELERMKKLALQEEVLKQEKILEVAEDDEASEEEMTLEETKELEKEVKKDVKNIYHISQNKNQDSPHHKEWRVRKEGSKKTIKYFRTQKEAIDFANKLVLNNDGHVVVHRVDGKIRKQGW